MDLPPQPAAAPPAPQDAPTVANAPSPVAARPAPAAAPAHHRRPAVVTGGVIGLIVGVGLGYDHFRRQPGVYESVAVVSGTDAAAATAPDVLDRAARRLDAHAPFVPPLPATTSERVAYLAANVTAEAKDGAVRLTFRGPNPGDAPKYLSAVAAAYTAQPARSLPAPLPPAPAGNPPVPAGNTLPTAPAPSAVDPDAKIAAEREKLKRDLAAVTSEDFAAIEKRLAANRVVQASARGTLADADRDLAAIDAAGKNRADRVAVLRKLGGTPDPEPAGPSAEARAFETQLVSFQQKKAELGRRLGPDHRDMVAVEEQIRFVREQLGKLVSVRPAEDELDRFRAKLAADRATLAADAATTAAAVARDEATLAAAAPIRARLGQLAAAVPVVGPVRAQAPDADPPAPQAVPQPAPAPAAPAGPQLITAPTTGERVSPLLYKSLVPGGAIGLGGGLAVGFLASVVAGAVANRPRRERKPKPVAAPKPVVLSGTIRRTGTNRIARYDGPALGVPVFAQVPEIKAGAPVEKKSVEGWSPALVCFSRPGGPEAEAYRTARRELVAALDSAGHKAVVVTGPGRGEGKSTTAANLALSLAQSGKRVILVDCDYTGTKQQELFRLGRLGDSLKTVVLNDVDLRVAVRTCEVANFYLLPAGRNPVDGGDLLTRPRFAALVAELKAAYEYVILDAPPTTAERELKGLVAGADGVVLVVRGGADAAARADRATSEVAAAGSRVLGAVVTAAPTPAAAPVA